jgi:COMPASS component SWD1
MPVQLDLIDSESEEEFVAVGRGEMRRKSPSGQGVDYGLGEEGMGGSDAEGKKKVKSRRR